MLVYIFNDRWHSYEAFFYINTKSLIPDDGNLSLISETNKRKSIEKVKREYSNFFFLIKVELINYHLFDERLFGLTAFAHIDPPLRSSWTVHDAGDV